MQAVGVRFKRSGKIYNYDPLDLDLRSGDDVIVETARGMEFGTIVLEKRPITEDDILGELKPILRIADEEDLNHFKENQKMAVDALEICRLKIKEHGLDMRLVDCEYTFNQQKVIFYFTADERIDFRDLVRDLAYIFKIRIELRQIGVRDEAKFIGGLGSCGEALCCRRFMEKFEPVSINMSKDQSLSLNPSKISGACGRLMCCLRYEQCVYEEHLKVMPNIGTFVLTPDGEGTIIETKTLLKEVKVRVKTREGLDDVITYPLEDLKIQK